MVRTRFKLPGIDEQLINVLYAIAMRGVNPGPAALLREMQQAKINGVEFEFELYNVEQKADPINMEGNPWNSDLYFMFTKFRVKPKHITGRQSRPEIEDHIFYDAEAEEVVELPPPKKELPRGS